MTSVPQLTSDRYSGGRDGLICAWDLPLGRPGAKAAADGADGARAGSTGWRAQVQAHTHWINDLVLAQSHAALVSASSDLTVKVWRPHADEGRAPTTVGLHSDYVKCLSLPNTHANWVASGGLDHKICLWDLNGAGLKLDMDVAEGRATAKGSVYALGAGETILASGGPESTVRVWDPRSGRRVTKLVGHTDNVRALLITESGDTIVSGSSDQTVKVWSVTAGRCLHTLTMHNDSVWSLHSDHRQLAVFHSSDRAGLVAKTDVRGAADMDRGLCLAVCHEQAGVGKVLAAAGQLWTATSSASINRWADVDTDPAPAQRSSLASGRRRSSHHRSSPSDAGSTGGAAPAASAPALPPNCRLPLSNPPLFNPFAARDGDGAGPAPGPAPAPAAVDGARRHVVSSSHASGSNGEGLDGLDPAADVVVPVHARPTETIEGQHGLIKHVMLNDRRHVLTLDTAGEVLMWDLVQCQPTRSFGKRPLDEVAAEVNTMESVANWCGVDTRTGRLACVLEENYCFDAEMYADELPAQAGIEYREDQRINLGKWVLRYLFAAFIEEEMRRDEAYRLAMNDEREPGGRQRRGNAPRSIQMPAGPTPSAGEASSSLVSAGLSPVGNGLAPPLPLPTPGLAIGVATPAIAAVPMPVPLGSSVSGVSGVSGGGETGLAPTLEEAGESDRRSSHHSQARSSTERSSDYFSAVAPGPDSSVVATPLAAAAAPPPPPPIPSGAEAADERRPLSSPGADKESGGKEGSSLFGKKFRMSFGSRKSNRSASAEASKAAVADGRVDEADAAAGSEAPDEAAEDNVLGIVQEIRARYHRQVRDQPGAAVPIGFMPSLPIETPTLSLPASTTVIIQEDRPDSGGVADLYRGTVASVGRDADIVERAAPTWLGRLLFWVYGP